MNIGQTEIRKGLPVFVEITNADGKSKWKPGDVIDTHEQIKAVKVRYVKSVSRATADKNLASAWMPLSKVSLTDPTPIKETAK